MFGGQLFLVLVAGGTEENIVVFGQLLHLIIQPRFLWQFRLTIPVLRSTFGTSCMWTTSTRVITSAYFSMLILPFVCN